MVYSDSFMTATAANTLSIRTSQGMPLYCWWFFNTWSNVIGAGLKTLHMMLSVETVADVDELLTSKDHIWLCWHIFCKYCIH